MQELLLSIQITNYICISLIFVLIIQLFFKLFIKKNVYINISKIVSINFNSKFNYYLNKIIILNNKNEKYIY